MMRLRLLLLMLALTAVLAAAVLLGSPYAPVVQPVADIETVWAIEDARSESETPLVTALENHGVPLAYDAQENTFYCTLGMDNGDEWPDIHLTAPDAKDVGLVFVDDYSYDWCRDAIRDGYVYQVMAYTDEEFAYFDLVFTGLMQVQIQTQEIFSEMDIPVEAVISDHGQTLSSHARAHYRGGVTLHGPKKAYRLEFTRNPDGTGKTIAQVPRFGQIENLILIPMLLDDTMMRDRLAWDLYGMTHPEADRYGARTLAYAELFVNGEYEGLYLLMEPYTHETELSKRGGGSAGTSCVYRTGSVEAEKDRAGRLGAYIEARGYELHYEPAGVTQFAAIDDFIALCKEEDDAVFAQRLPEIVDIDSMIDYFLHLQGYAMIDNVFNNLFVIADYENGAHRIRFAPWDMDMSLGTPGHPYDMWVYFPPMDRALDLDVQGIRSRVLERWTQLRQSSLTVENVEMLIEQYMYELNDSGAAARNAQRWEKEDYYLDGAGIVSFMADRLSLMDQTLEQLAGIQGRIPMLTYSDYENKYGTIALPDSPE
ncbi:MAG: CotH kinase family protein [Clostridia bacterium]|nr:CotH kinase family protein [Clostridia bacterium]